MGQIAEVKNPDESKAIDCGSGLHVSTPDYWDQGDTLIACEVKIEDIITCQKGKLRVRKLKVIDEIEI